MRSEPRQRRAFDKTRRDPNHLAVWIGPSARTLKLRRDVGRSARRHWSRRNRDFFGLPLPIVPLADKAAPVLNIQIDRVAADAKRCFLIAVGRSGHDVHAIESTMRQSDRLALRNRGISRSFRRWAKLKTYAVIFEPARQHLCGHPATR